MKIIFSKYQGTGNDFIIIDNRNNTYDSITDDQVRFLCHRKFGIGADGLMLLNNADDYDFEMMYYNADGKPGSMCGNGGRCLVQFARNNGITKNHYHFIAADGPHEATFDEKGWVQLKMKDVEGIEELGTDSILNTGSPHYVKPVTSVSDHPVVAEGKAIRYSSRFSSQGININFMQVQPGKIVVRTYERGVEDETLSCGTGVTACALVFAQHKNGQQLVPVETGGGALEVRFYAHGAGNFSNIWLCGPATFVFNGHIELVQ